MSWVLDAAAVAVRPAGPLRARQAAPPSKSVTNRALLVAALAAGASRLRGPLDSGDARAMRGAVEALGARVTDHDGDWLVAGTGGRLQTPRRPVDAGLSGTTMRFVAAAAALAAEPVTITGQPPLLRRPVGPLVAALRALGAAAQDDGGHPPVVIGGGLGGGTVEIDASGSSQYVSAVLLAAPYARSDVTLSATGVSALPYIELTVDVMRRWGAEVSRPGPGRWHVRAGVGYRAREERIEYDASAAAHLFALAVATGGEVTVTNARKRTLQPDAALPTLFMAMGARVRGDGDTLTVTGPRTPRPVVADLGAVPDQVTTVAALAALAPGTSVLSNVAVARGHETDRLAALAAELGKLGVAVDERPDGLVVRGGTARGPARLATYDDHRLAMAFAALAARVPQVVVEHPGCVTKTYPRFWDDAAAAGLRLAPA